ncbi:unnamed protein product [Closterium sp. NIES-64]|nr:unnamed protein product [Closterium sp. NIES-64]
MIPDADSVLEHHRYKEEVSPHIDGWTSGGEGFGSELDSFPASLPSPTSSTKTSTTRGQEAVANQEDAPIDDATNKGEGGAASDLPPAGVSVPKGAESNKMEDDSSHIYDFAYPPDGIELAVHDATPRRVHFNPTVTVLGGEGQVTDTMTGLDVLFGKRQATRAFNKHPSLQQHVLGCAATGVPMVDLTYKEPKTLKEMTENQYAPLWQAAVDAALAKFDELEAYKVVDRADVPKGVTGQGLQGREARRLQGRAAHGLQGYTGRAACTLQGVQAAGQCSAWAAGQGGALAAGRAARTLQGVQVAGQGGVRAAGQGSVRTAREGARRQPACWQGARTRRACREGARRQRACVQSARGQRTCGQGACRQRACGQGASCERAWRRSRGKRGELDRARRPRQSVASRAAHSEHGSPRRAG